VLTAASAAHPYPPCTVKLLCSFHLFFAQIQKPSSNSSQESLVVNEIGLNDIMSLYAKLEGEAGTGSLESRQPAHPTRL
jgi:hypothetical protein